MVVYPDVMRRTLSDRLRVLELQAAQFGLATPVHLVTQIEALHVELAKIDAVNHHPLSQETIESLPPAELWKRLYDAIWEVEINLYAVQSAAKKDKTDREERQKTLDTLLFAQDTQIALVSELSKRLYKIILGTIITVGVFIFITLLFLVFRT